MVFVYFLAFSAFLLASVAGYFSIYGLASIFSGWFWEIIAMGIALEYAKLVAVSYLYRYTFLEGVVSRLYGYVGILILMAITTAYFRFWKTLWNRSLLPNSAVQC